MLTIGDFARATGLTAKALRLYDDLDLLPPAEVDPGTGYRYYRPEQVEPARLVARLRSAGVPLATIATITEADAPEVAVAALLSYWRQVEADTASARAVVTSLVDQLRGQETTMSTTATPVRSAHRAGQGARTAQLDALRPTEHRFTSQITGQRLFAVADGAGEIGDAADAALEALGDLDGADPGRDPLGTLDAAVTRAARAVSSVPDRRAGTTLTALLLVAERVFVATSATRGPIWSATARSSGSPVTTASSSPWSTRDCSPRTRRRPTPGVPC